jgi:hypothetical protein
VDPMKPGPMPLTKEWFDVQKTQLKQTRADKPGATQASHDVYTPSDAAKGVPTSKQDKFLEGLKTSLNELDPDHPQYLGEATERLIDGVLAQEYGEHFRKKKPYRQMKKKLSRTILEDPDHRESVEDFLQLFHENQHLQEEQGDGHDEESGEF